MKLALSFLISMLIACNLVAPSVEKPVEKLETVDTVQSVVFKEPNSGKPFGLEFRWHIPQVSAKDKARARARAKATQRGLAGQMSALLGLPGWALQQTDSAFLKWIGSFLETFGKGFTSMDVLFDMIPLIGVALG